MSRVYPTSSAHLILFYLSDLIIFRRKIWKKNRDRIEEEGKKRREKGRKKNGQIEGNKDMFLCSLSKG
jgi:hypothetical protein